MKEMQVYHPALYIGLGGSLDVYAGKVKRAPNIFIKLHLEWMYRVLTEPARIPRLKYLFHFVYMNLTRTI